ncbi:MAG TPA: DsbA family protein [Steroidobacteraceae bacterium]|nr:DsbA family protein [Steroidobacteraceae bacterium]
MLKLIKVCPPVKAVLLALAVVCSLGVRAVAQDIQLITLAGQKEMLANPGTPLAGASSPDVTLVEYFDYNCPFCKQLAPELESLIGEDHKVALVYKEWPIFGGISVYAAKAVLAAGWQGKYLVAHDTLMRGPRWSDEAQVDRALESAGISLDRLKKDAASHATDINALLTRSETEARALGLRGTPGLVVGRQIVPGVVDLKGLKALVARARPPSGQG